MRNIVLISLLLVACGDNRSKLDAATEVARECELKDNKAYKFVLSEDKDAKCEQYYCDVGPLHHYAVKCELTDKRRIWSSMDTANGPRNNWLNPPPAQESVEAEAKDPKAPKIPKK